MLLLCYFHFFLTDEGFLKKFIDSTKSLSPDEKGERLESDEVWDFLSLVLRETILVTGAENKCSATHCFHSSKFLLWCYFLSSFRDQLFFILSQNICEAHAACAQEGQTEVRDMTNEGSCAWILKNWLKYELQQIFALVITLWQESIAI